MSSIITLTLPLLGALALDLGAAALAALGIVLV